MSFSFKNNTFVRFAGVGVINTLVGAAVMFICYNVFGFSYWFSSAMNYVIGSIVSFFLNKNFTFKYKGFDVGSVVRFTVNILVCYAIAYGVAQPAVKAMLSNASTSVQDNIAMAVGAVLFVILNYFGQRYFAFAPRPSQESDNGRGE